MKEKENKIKSSLNKIPVPHTVLDSIIDNAVSEGERSNSVIGISLIKYSAAIVIISVLLFSSALASPTFASIVTKIPVIGSVFNYFMYEKPYYELYSDLSSEMGLIEESNGINIIIDQAIYDGNLVILSIVIEVEEEFGSMPIFESWPLVQGVFSNTSYEVEYVEDVGYVGVVSISKLKDESKTVNIVWEPESITSDLKTVEGDWKFKFSLSAIQGKHITVDKEVSESGVTVNLMDVIRTDVNLTVNYSQLLDEDFYGGHVYLEAEFYAIDNLGNEYEVPYNGGSGIVGSDSSEDILWNATIHGLDKNATSVTFFPFAHISGISSEFNEQSSKRIDFEPIIVNLD
ncbi:DUF4179 domain-containing protein [Sutcliffiella cohnii]|uniref:DUF4179 domain-containing protein n=1 Tax=Sutcliffiella cohnii TaxID=33932 RepID=UPI002E1BF14E|nr:DUF4179 domain-containing protein [Sutcliffiella cohnii]